MLLLAVIAFFVWQATQSQRKESADVVARVDACFSTLAARRRLTLDRPPPLDHPVIGRVAVAPSLTGDIDGFIVELAIEADAARDGDQQTVLRIAARPGARDWPRVAKPCKQQGQIPAPAHAALERLCAASHRVQVESRTLIAEPKVAAITDVNGHVRRIETDVERLDGWLTLALELARTL